jgi:ribosomal protein S20
MLAINQTAFQARTQIEQACTAIQNNDTQVALIGLNLAIKSIDNIVGRPSVSVIGEYVSRSKF